MFTHRLCRPSVSDCVFVHTSNCSCLRYRLLLLRAGAPLRLLRFFFSLCACFFARRSMRVARAPTRTLRRGARVLGEADPLSHLCIVLCLATHRFSARHCSAMSLGSLRAESRNVSRGHNVVLCCVVCVCVWRALTHLALFSSCSNCTSLQNALAHIGADEKVLYAETPTLIDANLLSLLFGSVCTTLALIEAGAVSSLRKTIICRMHARSRFLSLLLLTLSSRRLSQVFGWLARLISMLLRGSSCRTPHKFSPQLPGILSPWHLWHDPCNAFADVIWCW